jgi:murein DD-endopeptidase MepM/ murein hydrolase activator NlpD
MAITSPIEASANSIVDIGMRSSSSLPNAKNEFEKFLNFLDVKKIELERAKLPEEKKVKELSNIDLVSTFGSAGGLLSSLLGGGLDLAGLVRGMFSEKGKKVGGPSTSSSKPQSPKVSGNKLKIGGLRAIGITNAIFAGLDFATGLQEGESVGKAAAGAGGSLAGSLLGGAIGQALIPIPGLGFVLGSIAGGFLGGFTGDRVYETVSGEGSGSSVEEKTREQLKEQEKKQKGALSKGGGNFQEILMRFSVTVDKFEKFAMNFAPAMGMETNYEGTDEGGGNVKQNFDADPYDGPIDGETFNPLPNGVLSTREVGVRGGEYGANRGYPGGHSGQDIGGLPPGSPVVAWKTGKISYIGSVEPGDTILEIDHGGGVKSRYKHVVPTVPDGTVVYGGQQIAKLFAAKAYDEHLHFEVWKNGSHVNPMSHIKAAQKLPGPLSPEKAKEHSGKSNTKSNAQRQEVGVDLYPQKNQSVSQTLSSVSSPIVNEQLIAPKSEDRTGEVNLKPLPQSVMAASPRQVPQIQSYPSYSQGQSYIIERPIMMTSIAPTVKSAGNNITLVNSSGGGVSDSGPNMGQVVNGLLKSMLLTNLSSS